MTFDDWKNIMELAYYIAFILITVGLAYYAAKTYHFQADKYSEIFFKIHIPESEMTKRQFMVMLEVYNHANIAVKNIEIQIEGEEIETIDFLKPGETYYFPIGFAFTSMAGIQAHIMSKEFNKPTPLNVLCMLHNKKFESVVNMDIIFNKCVIGKEPLDDISRSLEKVASILGYSLMPDGLRRVNGSIPEKLAQITSSIESFKTDS